LIAEFLADVRALAGGELPADVRTIATCCILDWFGCAIAGTHESAVELLLPEIALAPDAPCSLVGRAGRTSAQSAALVNGVAGDALDFSDTNRMLNGHATATVWPAVFALAERTAASGDAALRAFVAGVEAACRVGAIAGNGVLETPFHPTAVAGPLGAAAAGAYLLQLDDAAFATALGIAATQAAGLAAAVGTMSKPLHAGTAAAAGTLAASLAARGFTGVRDALDADGGFFAAHTASVEQSALAAHRGEFLIRRTVLKEHAACALAQGSIGNMLAFKRDHDVADVASIRLQIAASSARICDIVAPVSGLEAKFSVRTLAAMALLGIDTSSPASFTADLVRRADVVALRERISVDAGTGLDVAVSLATVRLADGRSVERRADEREIGDPEHRRARTQAKFRALTAPYLTPAAARSLEENILAFEKLPHVHV
jgi:2-methylcitrate dehydratase PrpD